MVSVLERVVSGMAQKLSQFFHAPTTLSNVLNKSVQDPECDSFSVDAQEVDDSTVLLYILNMLDSLLYMLYILNN